MQIDRIDVLLCQFAPDLHLAHRLRRGLRCRFGPSSEWNRMGMKVGGETHTAEGTRLLARIHDVGISHDN